MTDDVTDVIIVGGGPAGLMAALKSALLFHTARLVDKGPRTGRAYWVTQMDNVPGYPRGVSGRKLMEDLRAQIAHAEEVAGRQFVTVEERTQVTRLARGEDGVFTLEGHRIEGREGVGDAVRFRARAVVLATGVVDRQPYIGDESRDMAAILPYANKGIAKYCILCDGHIMRGKRIAVLGLGPGSVEIAETLRDHFGASHVDVVMCIPCATGNDAAHDHARHAELIRETEAKGIPVVDDAITRLEGLKEDRIRLHFANEAPREYDRAWISLGWYTVNNELARQAGAAIDDDGYVRSTEDCEAIDEQGQPIAGLYVVGDLRAETWKQVPIALGDAETAIVHAYATRL